MERFFETIIDGIAVGSIYGALALALVLIFRSTGIVNFAQGEMAMFATFIAWGLTQAGLPIGLAVLATLLIAFVAGMVIERGLIRHFEGGQELTLVVVTLGLFILINGIATWIWGPQNRGFPRVLPSERVSFLGLETTTEAIGLVIIILAVAGLLYAIFQKTKIGLAMRAAAVNPDASRIVGVPVGQMLMLGWGLAAAVGAIAGVLVAPRLFLDVNLMGAVMIYAFASATLGGFDSAFGAIIGGWIIGIAEAIAGGYIDFIGQDLKILVPLIIILTVLLVRPQGLFGNPAVARV